MLPPRRGARRPGCGPRAGPDRCRPARRWCPSCRRCSRRWRRAPRRPLRVPITSGTLVLLEDGRDVTEGPCSPTTSPWSASTTTMVLSRRPASSKMRTTSPTRKSVYFTPPSYRSISGWCTKVISSSVSCRPNCTPKAIWSRLPQRVLAGALVGLTVGLRRAPNGKCASELTGTTQGHRPSDARPSTARCCR